MSEEVHALRTQGVVAQNRAKTEVHDVVPPFTAINTNAAVATTVSKPKIG